MLRPLRDTVSNLCKLETPEGAIARGGVEAMRAMFNTPGGQQLLGLLCMVAHPFSSRVRENQLDTGAADGRAEVVSLLIELGSGGAVAVPVITETKPCPESQ